MQPPAIPEDGRLVVNITHFARALRRAGLPVGTGRVVDAIRAVEAAGFTDKHDFYHTLEACFVSRPEHRQTFAQVFRLYWRDPQFLEHMMALLTADGPRRERPADAVGGRAPRRRGPARRRRGPPPPAPEERQEVEVDARLTFSAEERLRTMDFEQMSAAEPPRPAAPSPASTSP
jgi:uncharacterized protein